MFKWLPSFAYFERHHFNETLGWSQGRWYFVWQMLRRWSLRPNLFVQLEGFNHPTEFSQKIKVFKKLQYWKFISNEVSGRETCNTCEQHSCPDRAYHLCAPFSFLSWMWVLLSLSPRCTPWGYMWPDHVSNICEELNNNLLEGLSVSGKMWCWIKAMILLFWVYYNH